MRFIFVNPNTSTVKNFQKGFDDIEKVTPNRVSLECFEGDLATLVASLPNSPAQKTAVVSPANSLGFMGGGFDRAIAELFTGRYGDYKSVEGRIQTHVLDRFNGFVPPQSANIVDLRKVFSTPETTANENHHKVSHLVQIPTMAVPEGISATTVFYCMWSMLLAVDGEFDTVIFPAIGAGYGGISKENVARICCGAMGIFYMDLEPLSRGAAVLLFLKKDYKAFANAEDISKIESVFSLQGLHMYITKNHENNIDKESEEIPMEWLVFSQCLAR